MKVLAVIGLSVLALVFLIAPWHFVSTRGWGGGAGRGIGIYGWVWRHRFANQLGENSACTFR